MARVDITLNGRSYSVACENGQEQRVQELARHVDLMLGQVAARAPASAGEEQLLVLTALMLADESFDLRAELAGNPAREPRGDDPAVARAVDQLARRIEAIAARLEQS